MQALCDSGIEFDITSVVSPDGLDHPEAFISYFEPFTTHIREFHFNLHDELFIDPDDEGQYQTMRGAIRRFLRDC